MGIFPVFVKRLTDAADDVLIVDLDGEFAPAIEASRGEVD